MFVALLRAVRKGSNLAFTDGRNSLRLIEMCGRIRRRTNQGRAPSFDRT
jgi:hypothetical protein